MKNILAVIAGLIISVIIFSLFEFLSTMFNPLPTEIELSDKVAMKEYISTLPISAMILILAGFAIGSFLPPLGGIFAGRPCASGDSAASSTLILIWLTFFIFSFQIFSNEAESLSEANQNLSPKFTLSKIKYIYNNPVVERTLSNF